MFGIPADRLRPIVERFGRVDAVGESFTVLKIGNIDVSLPRRESKTGPGHRGFTVEGDPDLSFVEAARRRDFTINAIAQDPLTSEIIDPFNGRADMTTRTLRVVDRRTFGEDSLRVLRALQFSARFDVVLDAESAALCKTIDLTDLPSERVWGEFEKLLLQASRPSIGLTLGWDLGVIHQLLPELVPLATCPQDPEWHPEGDVWTHTLMVVDEARRRIDGLDRPRAVAIMLAAICHDIAKPMTTAMTDGRWRSPGHEEAGVAPTTQVLDRLNVHSIDGYDVRAHRAWDRRATLQTERVPQGLDEGQRRRVPSSGAEGRPRAAGAIRPGGLSWTGWRVRLLGDGLVHRARPSARRGA